jgi:DNA-binding transcriptional LysR family regulator
MVIIGTMAPRSHHQSDHTATAPPGADPTRLTPNARSLAHDLDSQTLRIVHAIAEHGSITAAASILGYSQPAISQTIKRLESKLGFSVLTRAGRGVVLTPAGDVIAHHAVTVIRAIDQAAGELADLAGLRTGLVRLAAFPSASSTIVPRLLGAITARHPGVQFSYLEAEPPEAAAAVRNHTADLALTFSYADDTTDHRSSGSAGLDVTNLWREDMRVVVSQGHPAATHQTTVELSDFAHEAWIGGCFRCRGHLVSLCARNGFVPRISYETDNVAAVLGMVDEGLGVALLPTLALARTAIPAGVKTRLPAQPDLRTIQLLSAPVAGRVPATAATITAIKAMDGSEWGLDPL